MLAEAARSGRFAGWATWLDLYGVESYIPAPGIHSGNRLVEERYFEESAAVRLSFGAPGGRLRMTRDGSEVTAKSEIAPQNLRLTDTTTLRVRQETPTGRLGQPAEERFVRLRYVAATLPVDARLQPGVQCAYFEGEIESLAALAVLQPTQQSHPTAIDLAPARRENEFGLRYDGLVRIDAPGRYEVFLNADDAARVRLGSEPDGLDLPARWDSGEARGAVLLSAGWHRLRVEYLQRGGKRGLKLELMPPGGQRMELTAKQLGYHGGPVR